IPLPPSIHPSLSPSSSLSLSLSLSLHASPAPFTPSLSSRSQPTLPSTHPPPPPTHTPPTHRSLFVCVLVFPHQTCQVLHHLETNTLYTHSAHTYCTHTHTHTHSFTLVSLLSLTLSHTHTSTGSPFHPVSFFSLPLSFYSSQSLSSFSLSL